MAAEHELVQELSREAKRQNKTLFGALNEAIKLYLEVVKKGRSADEVLKVLVALEIVRSLEAVPIPKILLDESLKLASKASKEELCRLWYEQGKIVGELFKTIAPTIDDFGKLASEYRWLLPLNLFEVNVREQDVVVVMTGVGYSATSSECTAHALRGLLEAYGLKVDDVEVSTAFVKVTAHKTI